MYLSMIESTRAAADDANHRCAWTGAHGLVACMRQAPKDQSGRMKVCVAFPPPTSTLTFVRVFTDRGKRTPQILCARVKPFVDRDGCHVWRFDGPLPPTSWVAFPPKHRSRATCKILSPPHFVVRLALLLARMDRKLLAYRWSKHLSSGRRNLQTATANTVHTKVWGAFFWRPRSEEWTSPIVS